MSLLVRVRALFSSGIPVSSREGLRAAGVRTESDAAHRIQRIGEHIAAMGDRTFKRVTEVTEFLDQWLVVRAGSGYIATPGWDDELASRDAHPTRADAVAYVAGLGGTLRLGREQVIDTGHDRA